MSSKHSGKSKPSTPGKNKRIVDIYEQFRPHSGIRYDLDQTEANLKAGYTKIKLQHTTVEYEPGQNLSPSLQKKIRYARERNRGPVWVFKEEIEKRQKEQNAAELLTIMLEKFKQNKIAMKNFEDKIHNEVMTRIGPKWFHELSPLQMENADTLHVALKQDKKYKCIEYTVDKLIGIGLVLLPHHTKIEYCIKHFHNCPTEFLLKIFQLTHDADKKDEYTLNDRILLSCITHLALKQTLRELHLRIPSPPKQKIVKRKRKFTFELQLKKQRKMKFKSPYLKPTIFIPQLHKHEIYMNRHKEYPSSQYFDYVDDMYNITYEEIIKKPTKGIGLENSKYSKPPRIKVRQIQSKIEKKKIYNLKKPLPYVSPCEIIFKEPEPEPEPPVETNVCNCTPSSFNKDTTFELQIKITTSHEMMTFTQKLCPYNQDCAVDELKLKDHCIIDSEKKFDETCPSAGFKKIEYTCECSTCKKPVNIISDNLNTFSVYNNQSQNVIFECSEATAQKPNSKVCKCPSIDSNDPCDDKGDVCDCTSKTEECTCCICAENKDFLEKLKKYNETYNTNIKPCLCACKCKKHRRNPCCLTPLEAEQRKCKYCFCNKIKRRPDIPMPGDDDEEENEVITSQEEPCETPQVPFNTESGTDPTKSKKFSSINPTMVSKSNATNRDSKQRDSRKTSENSKQIAQNKMKAENDANNINVEDSEESVCEECKCAKMYNEYLKTHDSCLDLFMKYQSKMKKDLEDYLKDLEERCICGDSLSNIEEEEDMYEDSICSCLKATNKPEYKSSSSDDDNKCNCDDSDSITYDKCQCQPQRKLTGTPTCDYGRAQLEGITEYETAENVTTSTQVITDDTTKKISNITSSTSLKSASEDNSRIFSLKKLPTTRRAQMHLLKKVLQSLAEDGYPLAQLPDVHLLPIFKLWFDKRNDKYISMEEREIYTKKTFQYLGHISKCKRVPDLPVMKWKNNAAIAKLTWDKVYMYQKYVYGIRDDFNRRFKRTLISMAQENFPAHFTYQFPNNNFRKCYFAYMPADENHAYVFKPWKIHEVKKRKNS